MIFKVVSGLSAIQFSPYILFKRRQRALGNSTLRNSYKLLPKQTNVNAVLLHVQSETGTPYQTVLLKSSQWRLLQWSSCAIFKNAYPGTFFTLNTGTMIIF